MRRILKNYYYVEKLKYETLSDDLEEQRSARRWGTNKYGNNKSIYTNFFKISDKL